MHINICYLCTHLIVQSQLIIDVNVRVTVHLPFLHPWTAGIGSSLLLPLRSGKAETVEEEYMK